MEGLKGEYQDVKALLESGVLYGYAKVAFDEVPGRYQVSHAITAPGTLNLYCSHDSCSDVMTWDLAVGSNPRRMFAGRYEELDYACRHSPEVHAKFWVFLPYQDSLAVLVGRWPRATPLLRPELERALGEHDRYFYETALTARADGHGIAAVTYMRRVIENEIDRLIDLLVELLRGKSDNDRADAFERLKDEHQFEKKSSAVDELLPPSFFPGRVNPFARIHDLVSDGVHNLDDVESSECFDECQGLFELLFLKLLSDREAARAYTDGMKRIPRRKSDRQ